MPKIVAIKQNRFKHDAEHSVDLFGDIDIVSDTNYISDLSIKNEKETEKNEDSKRRRSQVFQKEHGKRVENSEKTGRNESRIDIGNKKDNKYTFHKNNSVDGFSKSDNGIQKKTGNLGTKINGRAEIKIGTINTVKGNNKEIQGTKRNSKELDINIYPISEFTDTHIIMVPKNIEYGPYPTSDPFVSEIIIDGRRYKVSTCSIRQNTYNQGFDSLFLIKHYHPQSNK